VILLEFFLKSVFCVFEFTLPKKRFCIRKRRRGFGSWVGALFAGSRLLPGSSPAGEENRTEHDDAGQYRSPAPLPRRVPDKLQMTMGTPPRAHPGMKAG